MTTIFSGRTRRFSLSLRVSLLLMLAVLLPLIITIISSEIISRPQLITRANAAMEADAQAHIQTIENNFSQPIIDVNLLSQSAAFADYLNGDVNAATNATTVLIGGYQRNVNYINWSLIDLQGNLRLSYPTPAQRHGKYFIPPDTIKQLTVPGKILLSSAFFDPLGNELTVDIAEPITAANGVRIVGFLRATLNINFLWNMVQGERGLNGKGSYAFITDENGVIIAHTDITQNFSAIAPFTVEEQQNINMLARYGNDTKIPVLAYDTLANELKNFNQQATFQMIPPMQQESFQVIGKAVPVVPWTYFVLSPTNVVTALADQQLLNIGVIGLIVLLLAAVTGLIVGRSITAPVLRSATNLQSSSLLLKDLAAKEQITVTEQVWVVDASRTGLSSVNYYTDATQKVARQMVETGSRELESTFNPQQAKATLHQMIVAAQYIDHATQYQQANTQKLSAALDLTKQVTEQLASSAESATQAAEQMEHVVSQLQKVVGEK